MKQICIFKQTRKTNWRKYTRALIRFGPHKLHSDTKLSITNWTSFIMIPFVSAFPPPLTWPAPSRLRDTALIAILSVLSALGIRASTSWQCPTSGSSTALTLWWYEHVHCSLCFQGSSLCSYCCRHVLLTQLSNWGCDCFPDVPVPDAVWTALKCR